MNKVFSNNSFFFNKIHFKKEHYTDNKKGTFCHYVARLEKGTCKIISKDKVLVLSEGDVFYIPMNLSYQSYWKGEDIIFNSLGFTLFCEGETQSFELQKIECEDEIKELIDNIPTGKATSKSLGMFYTLLSRLTPLMKQNSLSEYEKIYKNALDIMYKNPKLTVEEIATKLHVCVCAVYTSFKKASGKTPNTVKQEILCEKAIVLLSTTDKSVQEISDELGFSSSSYFRKVLKSTIGTTPRSIRKRRTF